MQKSDATFTMRLPTPLLASLTTIAEKKGVSVAWLCRDIFSSAVASSGAEAV